ncbi:hypothetical protein I4U23_013795 [Adineta vaga]|nr:hypothetical protein I4U23_013795 [Adineta vaga]
MTKCSIQLIYLALLAVLFLTNNIVQSAPHSTEADDESNELRDTRGLQTLVDFIQGENYTF